MRLVIQFSDASLTDFRWSIFDDNSSAADLDWQTAQEGDLAALASQHAYPLVAVIPQQCIYLAQVDLPEKAGRQLLGAIEYQVEDRLAQDIESQHFALGDIRENPISIAVVARDIMDRCLQIAETHGLHLAQVIPELFLCPWSGEGVVLAQGYDGWLLRYGNYRGIKCSAQALPAMLELVKRDCEIERIDCYLDASAEAPALEGYRLERHDLSEARSGLVATPLIDLQQRDYQVSSPWRELARTWKWIGLLVATMAIAFSFNRAIALQQLETELEDIRTQQYELVKHHLPGASPDADFKRLLIERMKRLKTNESEQGFLSLLLEFTSARSSFPQVEISRIAYQGNRLSFDISSKNLTDIESMHARVRERGVNARLESLNIKPELSSGRLVMEADDDG